MKLPVYSRPSILLDAELLKALRALGKPPSFDGNDAEYQDFRFSFRIHMSHVSSVSHEMMNRCEIERNPVSLAAVRALGDAHVKCCMQMYYALALLTKGSVRTLIRSVEGTNGAEAWRLLHGTQHRQHALMQKIMMLAKPWCDHTEGFESSLRSWELDVGKWENAPGTALADAVVHSDDEYGPRFFLETVCSWVHMPTAQLFAQPCCSGVTPLGTLERIRPRQKWYECR